MEDDVVDVAGDVDELPPAKEKLFVRGSSPRPVGVIHHTIRAPPPPAEYLLRSARQRQGQKQPI